MKINFINRKSNGHSIVRTYHNIKANRNRTAFIAAGDFAIAAAAAKVKEPFYTTVFGALSCALLNCVQKNNKLLEQLKPHYNEIVKRAEQIYSKNK